MNRSDPEALIWNTRERGRPDIVKLTWRLVVEGGCEAVFVISNPKVTKKIVYGMVCFFFLSVFLGDGGMGI